MTTCPPVANTTQLTPKTANSGSNCGPASASTAIAFAQCKRNGPGTEDVRQRMGVTRPGATSLPQIETGIASYGIETRRRKDAPWERAAELLANPRAIVVFGILYAAVPRSLRSSPSFQGGHYVAARGLSDGKVRVFDPLADGRRHSIPQGPQDWPVGALRRAAKAYSVDGDWSGVVALRPKPIITPEPEPEPEPEPTLEEKYDAALARISQLEAALDAIEAVVDDVEDGASDGTDDPEPDDDQEAAP